MNPPVVHYRISHWMYYHHMRHLSRVFDWIGRFFWHCFVPGQAQIGKNLQLSYWGLGVVVHIESKIGDNCHIGQNVTIGSMAGGVPELADNVRVGGGSFVFGKIKVGNNVIIGANSVVNKDVPDNAIVAGAPAKIIRFRDDI